MEQGKRLSRLSSQLNPSEQQNQQQTLSHLDPNYVKNKLFIIPDGLRPLDQRRLLRLLEERDPWEQEVLLRKLEGMDPWEQQVLLQTLTPLDQKLEKKQSYQTFMGTLAFSAMERAMIQFLETNAQMNYYYSLINKLLTKLINKKLLKLLIRWLSVYLFKEGHRGGFRNLLLDGWWLEFWEIILLAAGDVERNPGPRQMTDDQLMKVDNRALGESDLFEVYHAVYECCPKWEELCLALQIHFDTLSAVHQKRSGDPAKCLLEGLSLWLKRDYDGFDEKLNPPSWRMLVRAVAEPAGGGNHALALEVAENHKFIEATSSQTSKCVNLERSKQMSSAFSVMYRSVIRLLRVNVCDLKDSLRFLSDPHCLHKPCVPIDDYEDVPSTRELLNRLYKDGYINPENTFVLEVIVANCGSQRCKELVRKYTDKFH